ncbi:MAG: oxidoreductase [Mycobacterium sp.]|uniref:oxidoreductase n=1 Tax=Mycobacterium sp. TaxID=1785 RepID=UPI003CC69B43
MAAVDKMLVELWKSSWVYNWLRLKGYVAFDLPRMVTALGSFLLIFIAAAHTYVATTETGVPMYFKVYSALLTAGCLVIAGGMWFRLGPRVPQLSWFLGDLLAVLFTGIYLASRVISLRGLAAVTGRWDFAPGTFALAFAGAFVALHMSVLLRINVAYPDRQGWED